MLHIVLIYLTYFCHFYSIIMIFLKEVVIMKMDDTIFLFLCTLLVWVMTPGLSLFYGGLVHSKMYLIQ